MTRITITLTLKDQRLNPISLASVICNCIHQAFRGDSDNMKGVTNDQIKEDLRATGKWSKPLDINKGRRFLEKFIDEYTLRYFNVYIE